MHHTVRRADDQRRIIGAGDAHQHTARARPLVDRCERRLVPMVSVGHVNRVVGEGIANPQDGVGPVDPAQRVRVPGRIRALA